jgi:hypothetical protein
MAVHDLPWYNKSHRNVNLTIEEDYVRSLDDLVTHTLDEIHIPLNQVPCSPNPTHSTSSSNSIFDSPHIAWLTQDSMVLPNQLHDPPKIVDYL